MLPDGKGAEGHDSIPFDRQGAPCSDGTRHRRWSGARLKDPRRSASLMHA